MERRDGDAIQWIETVELAPGARESWVCCLEPGEIVAVSLSASAPVDAALVDLDAYETWDATDEMPSSPRFANDTRSVEWQAQPSSPLSTGSFGHLQPRRPLCSGQGDRRGIAVRAPSDRVRWRSG